MRRCILLSVLALVIGCKPRTIYIPLDSVKIEYKDKLWKDSIYIYDSIYIHSARDSVFVNRYKYIYKNKLVKDSVFFTDSIKIPYPVIETVEVNKLKSWQQFLMWTGAIFVVVFIILCVYKMRKSLTP